MKVFVAVLLFVALASAANKAAKIDYLPGIDPQPSYDMYSGYITLDNGQKLFYWLIEAETKPTTAPLMLWLNGGPGCSSLLGLFEENGPFRPDENANLTYFKGNWNQYANMLYVETPAFVGFSYWPGHEGPLVKYTDESTASGNHEFLTKWIEEYDEYKNRPFVIAGESYAGHYIPELANTLIDEPIAGLNFQGFAIGNPYVEGAIDDGPLLDEFLMTHAVKSLAGEGDMYPDGLDPYDVLADTCDLGHSRFPTRWNGHQWGVSAREHINSLRVQRGKKRYVPNPLPDCILDVYAANYLHRLDVQKAIHATPPKPDSWSSCSFGNYEGRADSTIPLIQKAIDETDLTIWIYSGDNDYVCNFISTESWILNLNRTEAKGGSWRSWEYTQPHDGTTQIAGFQNKFDRITFRTVKGAGHEVPRLQPAPALRMLQDFLAEAV
jgi:carboxypeptidase C (cathepsin A)